MKAFCGGTRYRIAIDEMPDTRDVVDLLEGIYIARREGDFYQETLLQESDGYRQKSRLNCFAPRSLYVMYCSLALLISICRRPSCGSTEARRASRASRATTSCATNGKMVRRMGVLVDDNRPSPPIMTLVTAALISLDDFMNVAHWSM